VFVHGLACAHEDWRNQADYFAPSHRVISLDQRGHGRSVGHSSGFDILHFGADVAALIANRDLPPVLLVGHSMGCRVILECARTAPEHVAGLVLIDGSRLDAPSGELARRATRQAMQESGYDAFFERLFTQMFTPSSDAGTRAAIVARARRLPRPVGSELTPQMFAWDAEFAEQALRRAKIPMTVIQSTHLNESRVRESMRSGDSSPWLELVRTLAPHADIEIVPGVGHFTMIEAADHVNRHIVSILEKIDAR
jgi:pimeloyl-ACP methyl ester carboxylesterase